MTFPAYKPSSRVFTAGQMPVSMFRALSGAETRIITGSQTSSHAVSLSFNNVDEQVAENILSHWYLMQGVALAFQLPFEVWAGWSNYAAGVSPDQSWRYSKAPNVDTVSPGIMNISVQLLSVLNG